MSNWGTFEHEDFVEVIPVNIDGDILNEHRGADECWCLPRIEHTSNKPMIIHNNDLETCDVKGCGFEGVGHLVVGKDRSKIWLCQEHEL